MTSLFEENQSPKCGPPVGENIYFLNMIIGHFMTFEAAHGKHRFAYRSWYQIGAMSSADYHTTWTVTCNH